MISPIFSDSGAIRQQGTSEFCSANTDNGQRGEVSLYSPKPVNEGLNKPARPQLSPKNPYLRRSHLCYSVVTILRIGRDTRCTTVTFTPDLDLFDYRALTIWGRSVAFRRLKLRLVQRHLPSAVNLARENITRARVFSTINQCVQPRTRIGLITGILSYQMNKRFLFSP